LKIDKGVGSAMKTKVAFVCVGNSCRSQMAEGFASYLGRNLLEAYSAGTDPAPKINPIAIRVMKEVGVDLDGQYPKLLDQMPQLDVLITMGCNVECPTLSCKYREDWGLPDPVGQPVEVFRRVRDTIKEKVKDLIEKLKAGQIPARSNYFKTSGDDSAR
jgi:arsenate reductase